MPACAGMTDPKVGCTCTPETLTTMPRTEPQKKRRASAVKARPQTPKSKQTTATHTPISGPFQLRQSLGWPASEFGSIAWSPDGQHVAAGSADRCVRIWNTITGELEHLLEDHQQRVQSVAWSPDGRLLASGA